MGKYQLFIKDASSTGTYSELKSPFDGSLVAEIEKPDAAALEQALVNAHSFFHSHMKQMPAYERARILYAVADLIEENHQELSLTIAREGGKPLKDARGEVTRAINTTKMSGDAAMELNGEQISMDRSAGTENHIAFTLREPVGPVLAISAFNHPVNLICHQVCTAFAAGNTVIVKPASQTAVSCFKIAEFFRAAGLPDGIISVANAAGAETELLVSDARVRFISFIGGEDVGWAIQKKMQPGVGLALEHGGAAAAIIDKAADLEKTIPSVVRGGFYHAGQVCISTQIAYVHEEVVDTFVKKLLPKVEALVTGDPTSAETDVGPLISKKDVDRVHEWVQEAVAAGAELLLGGEKLENNCYAPTVLRDVSPEMKVMSKEIFGPVLCIRSYADIDAVVEEQNATDYSFQSAVYTQDIDLAYSTARKLETKACIINDMTAFRVDWSRSTSRSREPMTTLHFALIGCRLAEVNTQV